MTWLFLATLLAQTPDHWVWFEVCQINLSTVPPTLARTRDHATFHVHADHVVAVGKIHRESQGLECAEIYTSSGRSIYVIGAPDDVMRKLDGPD